MFYPVDKRIANAEYMTTYYLPRMESMLDYIFVNQQVQDEQVAGLVLKHRTVLQNEFAVRLEEVGYSSWPGFEALAHLPLDSSFYEEAKMLLGTLNKMYLSRQQDARSERQEIVQAIVNRPGGHDRYRMLMQEYTNDQVSTAVKDNLETTRISEYRGRLVRRIYPVYMDPDPRHVLDFGAPFYAPQKYFAGMYIDTLYFNIGMIWFMSAILIVLLYFDVLRNLVNRSRPFR
jgi:hypothetical protein